jgi:histo-blood group ABO system transferase
MKHLIFCLINLCVITCAVAQTRVGFLIVATGNYIQFVEPLIESARTYFCPDCKVTYYVFTDGHIPEAPDIVSIYQEHREWPYDSMLRCKMYYDHRDVWAQEEYLFSCDADMRFVDTVGSEVLSKRVATLHYGFIGRRGTYEKDSRSTAYIGHDEGKYYFAGGFYGGKRKEFITMIRTLLCAIEHDLAHDIIAVWHDESHLNRYFLDHKPTVMLSPSYCYPEGAKKHKHQSYHPRLLALDKNHKEMRK